MSTILDKIHSRGYWRIVIRPVHFDAGRVEYANLLPILEKNSVQYRSLCFPHIDRHANPPERQNDWIGCEFEFMNFIEAWRFYQSGQFAQRSAMWLDWRDLAGWGAMPDKWEPGKALGTTEMVFRFTEILEFAARLALTEAGDNHMHIDVTVCNLKNRVLFNDNPSRLPMFSAHKGSISEYVFQKDFSKKELVSRPRDIALEASRELFLRFDWEPTVDLLRSMQPQNSL